MEAERRKAPARRTPKSPRRRKILLVPPALRGELNSTFGDSGGGVRWPRRGAPLGNKNAWKHGKETRERRAFRAEVWTFLGRARALTQWAREVHEWQVRAALAAALESPRPVPLSHA